MLLALPRRGDGCRIHFLFIGENIAQQNKILSIKTIIKEPNINYKCIYA